MSNQNESSSTTLKLDLQTALHVAATADCNDLRALGALAAATILFRNIDWAEFRKVPEYTENAEIYRQLLNDIGNSIESGVCDSDFDDDDGDDAKGGAA